MPQSGWLAIGAACVAWLAGSHGVAAGWLFASVGVFIAIALAMAGSTGGPGSPRGRSLANARSTAVCAVGASAIALRLLFVATPPPSDVPDGRGTWSAVVESVSSPRAGQQVATVRLEDPAVRLYATLPRYPAIAPGDRVTLAGMVSSPPEDGFGQFLRASGMGGTLRAAGLALVAQPDDPGRLLEQARRGSGDGLAHVLPEPEAGLAAGILVGLRDRVDRDLAAAFTTAGVSHVVAISGWNIAIVGATVAALARRASRRRRALLTTLAVALYTAFAGASPSVLRAAVMAGVVLAARESGRGGRAAAALGWAAVLLLLVDPGLIDDAGFQLSTLATGGLLAWASPLTARLRSLRALRRVPDSIVETLGVSLAAQAATLPVVVLAFGRLSLVSPAVNLLVVPLVAPAMALGGIALLAGWLTLLGLPSWIGALAALPAWVGLGIIIAIVRFVAALPLASIAIEPPASALIAAASTGVIALVGVPALRRRLLERWRRAGPNAGDRRPSTRQAAIGADGPPRRRKPGRHDRRLERLTAAALAIAIGALVLVAATRPDGRVIVTVLDVGQGDAILVEGDRGSRMLVDGGPDPDRLLAELDERLPPWDRRIDLLVLTHPHDDHVGGLPVLLERYRVAAIVEPGMLGEGPGYAAFAAALVAGGRRSGRLATGDRFDMDDIDFRVLWPDPGAVARQPADTGTGINDVSIVLLGTFGKERFLLTGDLEEDVDPTLVARGLPRLDFLKVAHHGSRTATSDALLDAVRPLIAAISVGAGNSYGHPSSATLGRLLDHGARVFRTDLNGSVEIALDGTHATVTPDLGTAIERAQALAATVSGAPPVIGCPCGIGPARRGTAGGVNPPRPDRAALGRDASTVIGWRPSSTAATAATAASSGRVGARGVLYHRADVGSRAGRSRQPASRPGPADLVPAPLPGGRRDRGMAGAANRLGRPADRPPARRVRGAPPRRRQDPAAGRPRPPPPAR